MNHNQPAPLLLSLGIGLALGALGASWYLGFGSDPGGRGLSGGPGAAASQANQGASLRGEPPAPSTLDPAEPSGSPAPVRRAEQPGGRDLVTVRLAALERAYRAGDLAPEALTELAAESLIDAGLPGEALDLLLEVGSQKTWLYSSAGRALARLGEEPQAIEAFTAAIRLDPGGSSARAALSKLDPELALNVLRDAIAAAGLGGDADSQADLASALEAAGYPADAQAVLEQRLALNPASSNLLARLARLDPAAYELRLVELVKDDAERWLGDLVEHLDDVGRTTEAMAMLEEQLMREPGDLYWLETMGQLAPARALTHLLAQYPGLEPSEDVAEALRSIGSAFSDAGDLAGAIEAWTAGVQREPLDDDGELAWDLSFYRAAPAALARALEQRRTPGSTASFHGELADVLWQAGETDKALASWRRAAALEPESDHWPEVLARVAEGGQPYK